MKDFQLPDLSQMTQAAVSVIQNTRARVELFKAGNGYKPQFISVNQSDFDKLDTALKNASGGQVKLATHKLDGVRLIRGRL